jgi:acetyl-CoA carboxylase beta subunit
MCKHCSNEKAAAIKCECKCSDYDWEDDSDSESQLIQQDVVWIKCNECKHYVFLKAISPKIIVGREMKARESLFHPLEEQRLHALPEPVPKLRS